MYFVSSLLWAAAFVGNALSAPAVNSLAERGDTSVAYFDSETGFTFSEYKAAYSLSSNVVFRIATPSSATQGQPFDTVIQVVAPIQVGWAGLAWGGSMLKNPLTVGWANGNQPQISSRYATGRSLPQTYTGATYTKLTAGNKVNGTHWQFTAKCSGCSEWESTTLNPKGSNKLAFGYAAGKPSQPSSPSSSFPIHDVHAYWSQDFTLGANANFADLLKKNGVQ